MNKSYWPSSSHLSSLREEGKYPYSRCTTACCMIIGLLIGGRVQAPAWGQTFSDLVRMKSPFNFDLNLCVAPLLLAAAFGLLSVLVQSRFLFRFQFLLPQGNRLILGLRAVSLTQGLGHLLSTAIAIGLGIFLAIMVWGPLVRLLNFGPDYFFQWVTGATETVFMLTSIFLFVIAIISYFCSVVVFSFGHRMTREEFDKGSADL